MKKLRYWTFGFGILMACALSMKSYAQQQSNYPAGTQSFAASHTSRLGVVNTKKCLEESKLGKQEQANFDKMKNQMEAVLKDKEALLEEIESKLDNDDYMDSISDEAASELKRKKRTIRSEGMQLQSQYMQTLQQANIKIIQKLTEAIAKASAKVAQETPNGQAFDAIFTDEALTFYARPLDITKQIIDAMDEQFNAEQKNNASK